MIFTVRSRGGCRFQPHVALRLPVGRTQMDGHRRPAPNRLVPHRGYDFPVQFNKKRNAGIAFRGGVYEKRTRIDVIDYQDDDEDRVVFTTLDIVRNISAPKTILSVKEIGLTVIIDVFPIKCYSRTSLIRFYWVIFGLQTSRFDKFFLCFFVRFPVVWPGFRFVCLPFASRERDRVTGFHSVLGWLARKSMWFFFVICRRRCRSARQHQRRRALFEAVPDLRLEPRAFGQSLGHAHLLGRNGRPPSLEVSLS